MNKKWKFRWWRDRTIWTATSPIRDFALHMVTGPTLDMLHHKKTYNTDNDYDDSSRSPLVVLSYCLQPAQIFEKNVGSIFRSNCISTDTDLMSSADNWMWLWLKTLWGRVCVFTKYLELKQIWFKKEKCHADNSSGGVSLCQSVALDVEDFGNGALETEGEIAKTVGGHS